MSNRIISFIQESKQELQRVNWPTKEETRRYTVFVIAFSLAFSAFLGLIDLGFLRVLRWILPSS